MIEALFAFAVEATGATAFCKERGCKAPTALTVSAAEAGPAFADKGGWYNGGERVQVKREANTVRWEVTYVHEAVHYLQSLRGQMQGYVGSPCVRWKTEAQAYEVAEKYARTKGYTTNFDPVKGHAVIGRDKAKCEAMIERGLVKEFKL